MVDLKDVTNSEFLDAIFGNLHPDERIWVAWFKTPPKESTQLDWAGKARAATSLVGDYTDLNTYFAVSTVVEKDGILKRRKTHFCRMPCVVIDDAVTSMECSWKLRTSTGKHQVGFILSDDIRDVGVASRLQKELARQSLVPADDNGYNPVRYVRLPASSNTNYGEPIRCRLVEWNPEKTYSVQEICVELRLNYDYIINGGNEDVERAMRVLTRQSDDDLVKAIVTGAGYHDQLNTLAARYIAGGMSPASAVQALQGLMSAVAHKDERWKNRFADIERSVQGAFEKFKPAPRVSAHQDFGVTEQAAPRQVMRNKSNLALALKMVDDAEDYDNMVDRVIPAIRKLTGITHLDIKSIAKRISMRATQFRMVLGRSDVEPMLRTDEMREIDEQRAAAVSNMASVAALGQIQDSVLVELLSWVFVESDGGYFFDPASGRSVTRSTFNLLYVGAPIPQNGEEQTKPDDFFILAGGRVVNSLIYMPHMYNKDDPVIIHNGRVALNTYRPINIPAVPSDWAEKPSWKAFRDHLELVFPEDHKLIIQYLAHNVQMPGSKIRWCLLLKGAQGDGKTTISRVLAMVMGDGCVKVVSNEALGSQFNGWAFGSCVIALEEVRAVGHSRYDVYNKLKPIVTNDVIEIVRKGKDGFEVPNVSNIIAMTNFEDALPLDNEDRRFGVAFSQFTERAQVLAKLPSSYFDALYDLIHADPGSIRGWLLSVDLAGFNRHEAPPSTSGKKKMAIESLPMDCKEILSAMDAQYMGIHPRAVDVQVINAVITKAGGHQVNTTAMKKAMGILGWEKHPLRTKIGGDNRTIYIKKGDQEVALMGSAAIRELLLTHRVVAPGSTGYDFLA